MAAAPVWWRLAAVAVVVVESMVVFYLAWAIKNRNAAVARAPRPRLAPDPLALLLAMAAAVTAVVVVWDCSTATVVAMVVVVARAPRAPQVARVRLAAPAVVLEAPSLRAHQLPRRPCRRKRFLPLLKRPNLCGLFSPRRPSPAVNSVGLVGLRNLEPGLVPTDAFDRGMNKTKEGRTKFSSLFLRADCLVPLRKPALWDQPLLV
jgi:hypothetical protein